MTESLYNYEIMFGNVKFGEIDNPVVEDFERSLELFLSQKDILPIQEPFDTDEFRHEIHTIYYY